jgi:hypothetical protein
MFLMNLVTPPLDTSTVFVTWGGDKNHISKTKNKRTQMAKSKAVKS